MNLEFIGSIAAFLLIFIGAVYISLYKKKEKIHAVCFDPDIANVVCMKGAITLWHLESIEIRDDFVYYVYAHDSFQAHICFCIKQLDNKYLSLRELIEANLENKFIGVNNGLSTCED